MFLLTKMSGTVLHKFGHDIFNSLRPSDTYMRHIQHTNIASDDVLSPVWCKAIIWTNAAILSIRPLGINFSEILFKIQKFSCKKMHLKMLLAKWRPFYLNLKMLTINFINLSV